MAALVVITWLWGIERPRLPGEQELSPGMVHPLAGVWSDGPVLVSGQVLRPVVRIVLRRWTVAALVALPASLWGQEVVPISTDIPECSVRLREVLSLGAFDDPGTISDPSQITRIGSGDYALASWLNGAEIMVFDSTGRYRRSLGRAGEGPGEFLDPGLGRLRAAPDGNLLVLDPALRRITRLSGAGEAVETVDLGSLLAFNFMPLSAAGPFAVGGWGGNQDAVTHIVDAGGATIAELSALPGEPWMQSLFFFPMDLDPLGRVWWAHPTEYVVEARHPGDSAARTRLEGRPRWYLPGPPGAGHPLDDPYPSVIRTLRVRDGLVWIGTMVADLEWAEYGEPSSSEPLDLTRLIDTVIEVIDPSTGEIVARAVHHEDLMWTGDGSFLYSVREDGLVPRAVLFSPSFVGRECPPSGG